MEGIKRVIFIVWIVVIAILSIVPHANEDGGLSLKLSESGMLVHFVAYFVGLALIYWARKRHTLFSILFFSFGIFVYGIVLEIVQFYLPYRTFNPIDIAANASGIALFSLVWAVFRRRRPGMEIGAEKRK